MNINITMLAISESLKRLHDKQQDHYLSLAESAKKAKLATQVNPEIWGKLNRFARLNDLKLSRVQEQVTKVGHILVKNTENLLRAKSDSSSSLDDPVRMNIDALALLGHAAHELTQRQRESIKPDLHKDYSTLCSATVPVKKLLFGDDLQTELTHIKATNKIGATASSPITPGQASYPSSGSCQGHHFFGRAPQFSRPTNYKFQTTRSAITIKRRATNELPVSRKNPTCN